ncbi:bacitracin ABC transporter ATP-binding protein [Bacillus thuringiensis]|uniref:ABC transporter ATP-binding protein n=1 Tax=Bacillus cereus group TaxID=86661 RepID=UPI000BEB2CEE|nr:ABC transporter ATP-binding protein [Bacillus thuringiensis]HDR8144121.1 ABC transporter ATP-binding protein [Bacillus cereus]PEA58515.1 bacitracin ABC transporter ATP-binding protein [Bacillus thuringiensis]PFW16938.1 bacitracin ABC transporter ATP-binding protein [Bacillus thuringiensis]PGP33027.1 bacitracin ABC transporter ATP-binding protein [Bacillus thuringiensis]PGU18140.1 bacitracin ABC transporter ATP-binding protein [Bacillus thuringiensis]
MEVKERGVLGLGIPIVQLKNVNKVLGNKTIIEDMNFEAYEGEVFGFLGPNGAGKTTTIRMMVGLANPTRGDILIDGNSIIHKRKLAIKKVGAIVENPELYKFMTGYQNLKYFGRIYGNVTKEKIDEIVELVDLTASIHDKVKTYSLGMRQRLGIAQALLHDPKVLILDEPTNGLDPAGIREIREYLQYLAHEKKMCIIVSSHLLTEMELMCDRIIIIQNGKVVDTQSVRENRKENEVLFEVKHPQQAREDILAVYSELDIECLDNLIKVCIKKEEIPLIINLLSKNNHQVYGIKETAISLEERFLEITGKGERKHVSTYSK